MLPKRIELNPSVLAGKPVIHGTRISVAQVLAHLAAGWTNQDILANYPRLEVQDILACIEYASVLVQEERLYPLQAV